MGVINKTTEKINELLDKIEDAPDKIENGKTPVFVAGTTTTLDPGMSATVEVVLVGTDPEGNPQYKINIGVPKGLDGTGGSGGGVADSIQWANVLNKPSWVNSATKPSYTASEVGALPAGTFIPSKVSDLTNDSKFLTSADFKTINGQPVVGAGNIQIEGGSSGGGTGNVNVTNASSLKSSEFYAFKPSSDGSVSGEFLQMPLANSSEAGLLSPMYFAKILSMKQCVYLPIAFEKVNSSTTKEELLVFFKTALQIPDLNFESLVAILQTFSVFSNSEGSGENAKFYIGNNDCLFRGLYTEEENKLLTEFTYIAIGGRLKTISILFSNIGASDASKVELSISIKESGDDKIYLSRNIFSLSADSTIDEVYSAFGGKESFNEIFLSKDNSSKSFFILYPNSSNLFWYSKPAFVEHIFPFLHNIIIITFEGKAIREDTFIRRLSLVLSSSGSSVSSIENNNFYLNGKILDKKVYSLKDSSSSDDISSAIGGESGLKSIIKNIKAGNRLKIGGVENETNFSVDLSVWCYNENENGDLGIAFVGFGYGIFGTVLGGMLVISFTKSTNEFASQVFSLPF